MRSSEAFPSIYLFNPYFIKTNPKVEKPVLASCDYWTVSVTMAFRGEVLIKW